MYGVVFFVAGVYAGHERVMAGDRSFRSAFFVDQYGALHNGTDDDRQAIQDALNDARAADGDTTGGVVQFGAGVYRVSSPQTGDAAFAIGGPVIFRGVGPGDRDIPGSGTVISWEPSTPGVSLMKIGFRTNPPDEIKVGGVGLEDLTIVAGDQATSSASGHVLRWSAVEISYMKNVQIIFDYADVSGRACLSIEGASGDQEGEFITSALWFTNCRFVATSHSGREGHGVLIESALKASGPPNVVNDCNFVNCTWANAKSPPGADLLIHAVQGLPGEVPGRANNNSFVNCRFTWTQGLNGAVRLLHSDQNRFVNCTLDGVGFALWLDQCEGTFFVGAINGGSVIDTPVDADTASRLFVTNASGSSSLVQVPYFTLMRFPNLPGISSAGTLWYGKRTGTAMDPDSLFVFTNAGLKYATLEDPCPNPPCP
jgi:hypothetical protein